MAAHGRCGAAMTGGTSGASALGGSRHRWGVWWRTERVASTLGAILRDNSTCGGGPLVDGGPRSSGMAAHGRRGGTLTGGTSGAETEASVEEFTGTRDGDARWGMERRRGTWARRCEG
jgi:hypothetical protein